MNGAHWHLALNHLPIIIPFVGICILIGGFIFKSDIVKRTAFAVFILGALTALPAFLTGEGAEEIAENLSGVTKSIIHDHEELAETFAILSYLLGGLSIVGLWSNLKQKSFANIMAALVIIASLAVLYFGKQTGTSGGEIRHTEIRADFNATQNSNSEINGVEEKEED